LILFHNISPCFLPVILTVMTKLFVFPMLRRLHPYSKAINKIMTRQVIRSLFVIVFLLGILFFIGRWYHHKDEGLSALKR
jgi:hypothetical protein